MKIRQMAVIAMIGLSIAGCSHFRKPKVSAIPLEPSKSESVVSSGLGEENRIDSRDKGTSVVDTDVAHNQTYHFEFDSSAIGQADLASLNAQAKYIAGHPSSRVLIAGHTDVRGSREYNVALGERRAQSVQAFLLQHGATRQQIRVVSYGREKPVAFGNDENAHQQNRRAELIYEDEGR